MCQYIILECVVEYKKKSKIINKNKEKTQTKTIEYCLRHCKVRLLWSAKFKIVINCSEIRLHNHCSSHDVNDVMCR